ncbi:MAG TPA: hypothetical protein DCX41_12745 [Aequorivita sp.]|nr:hypothetical protein [Aequorivita sp.]MBF29701.1 hypothetical protein [Aequorivita sp.]HAV55783.1 hypothetical protein [Aequorivita sp.]|tara:strand:+ start:111585 stop:111827 length:243 start_codon:yes stop_codon:yes gene_type:complete
MDIAAKKYKLIESLMTITNPEKLQKVDDFLNSEIFNEVNYTISETHKKILDERLEKHKNNPKTGRTIEEIESELSRKYGL